MDQIFTELWPEIVGGLIVVLFCAVGSAILRALKNKDRWRSQIDLLLYAIVGGVVAFICMSLFVQIRLQREISEKLASERPTRPYFTQTQTAIQNVSPGIRILPVSVQNNDVPAKDVVSQLLVLEESLDPTREPLHTKREEPANAVGPRGIFSHYWSAQIRQLIRPTFIVFQIRYTDALSNETYSQTLFLKFLGAAQDGTFFQQLFNASSDEKTRMERYMRERGIPML